MDLERIDISLQEKTFENIYRDSNKENAQKFKLYLKTIISDIKEVMDADFNLLSDQELYILLNKIYNISFDEDDYLKMLSEKYKKNYVCSTNIATTMTFQGIKTEGQGKTFDYWSQLFQVHFKIIATQDVKITDKPFTKNELKKLIENKSILILSEYEIPIEEITFEKEEYENFPLLETSTWIDNVRCYGKLLRQHISKKDVLKDLRILLYELEIELNSVFQGENATCVDYPEIAGLCKEWFDKSEVKKEYLWLKRELILRKKR